MRRYLKILIIGFIAFVFNIINVRADNIEIASFNDLNTLATTGGNARLVNDIDMTDDVRLLEDCTIDLNGHTIDTKIGYTLIVRSNVTIKDSKGNGKITNGQLDGEYTSSDYQSLQVGGKISSTEIGEGNLTIESGNYEAKYVIHMAKGTLTINGGSFKGTSNFIIGSNGVEYNNIIINDGEFNYTGTYQAINLINASVVMNGGSIKSSNGSGIVGFRDSSVTINGGTIEANDYAIAGNGSSSGAQNDGTNAKFTINGGTLKALDGLAVYAPQINGETKITGGTLIGSETGLEIRAGKLTVSGGKISGNIESFTTKANGNGPSTVGAGIAVSQHTTKEPIDVKIEGGTITGAASFAVVNPQNNSASDLEKIKVSITDGTFNGSLISEDITNFISGGKYNATPENLVKQGYIEYTTDNKEYVVLQSATFEISEEQFFVKVGDSIKYIPNLNETYNKYIKVDTSDKTIATYSDGYIKGIKAGSTPLIVSLGRSGDSKLVYVYEVKSSETNSTLNEEAAELIEKALNDETVEDLTSEMVEKLREAIIEGKEITSDVEAKEISKEDLDEKTIEKIDSIVKEKGITVAKYLDIDVLLKIEGKELGNLTKLPNGVSISVSLDKNDITVPSGYNREFYVIRLHDGEEPKLLKATLKGNVLTFETDEFSTYVVTYNDTVAVNNPKTGDKILFYAVAFIISIMGLIFTTNYIKKRI